MTDPLFSARAWRWGLLLSCFFIVSCSDEECYYCGKDVTGGITADADEKVIGKEADIVPEDTAEPDASTDESQPDDLFDSEQPDADSSYNGMVEVPAGKFIMGCNTAVDDECFENEEPAQTVDMPLFWIDKYEVTVAEYKNCIAAGACNNDDTEKPHYYTDSQYSLCDIGDEGKEEKPMNCVFYEGAAAYCAWAGKRLPTAVEWEKAARGTDGRKYPWGNDPVSCDQAVIYEPDGSGYACGENYSWPVGSKEAGKSPYGVYDMIGNVWEYADDDPGVEGACNGLRGGSWATADKRYLRASACGLVIDLIVHYGFRCAK
jgi:formylglycine-generating enzyme required for sulfatase activity